MKVCCSCAHKSYDMLSEFKLAFLGTVSYNIGAGFCNTVTNIPQCLITCKPAFQSDTNRAHSNPLRFLYTLLYDMLYVRGWCGCGVVGDLKMSTLSRGVASQSDISFWSQRVLAVAYQPPEITQRKHAFDKHTHTHSHPQSSQSTYSANTNTSYPSSWTGSAKNDTLTTHYPKCERCIFSVRNPFELR